MRTVLQRTALLAIRVLCWAWRNTAWMSRTHLALDAPQSEWPRCSQRFVWVADQTGPPGIAPRCDAIACPGEPARDILVAVNASRMRAEIEPHLRQQPSYP